ncbi:hypothetical protein [Hymenobacter sp. BRD67]|uniref:hypothetical protein n=1 Tax=Hymenobacter sp. BRD67 TaxID=2675877 RepID=UPI0015648785|nr:hypothetical protein [Hymenobacter sp. BRD67]QKG54942.1 hypothetical protein GKZ67_21180 [Hymenobacter sp. BRD67]
MAGTGNGVEQPDANEQQRGHPARHLGKAVRQAPAQQPQQQANQHRAQPVRQPGHGRDPHGRRTDQLSARATASTGAQWLGIVA